MTPLTANNQSISSPTVPLAQQQNKITVRLTVLLVIYYLCASKSLSSFNRHQRLAVLLMDRIVLQDKVSSCCDAALVKLAMRLCKQRINRMTDL